MDTYDVSKYRALTITGAQMVNEEVLRLTLDSTTVVDIFDNGQSCCESRYMTTDDDVSSLIGGKLIHITAKDGPNGDAFEDECHETMFVEVATDKGFITLVTHNEHNGYYGGFALKVMER